MSIVVHGGRGNSGDSTFPSPEDLGEVIERADEDIRMARLLVQQIQLSDPLAPHVVSALRESLLIRIFRLRHFYYGESEGEREVVGSDFFPGAGEWTAARPLAPPHLSRWLDDLWVWVADRTYADSEERVPVEAWPLASLVSTLARTHDAFCDAVMEHFDDSFVTPRPHRDSEERSPAAQSGDDRSEAPDEDSPTAGPNPS